MKRRTTSVLAVSVALALASAPGVFAGDGKQQIKLNKRDQAAARAAVLRRTDLGSSAWQGGPVKPDLSSTPNCPNFHPKVSDLVVTGAAQTTFQRSSLEFSSVAEVLKTRRMVRLDWRRSVVPRAAVPCLRRTLAEGLPAGARIQSFARLPFPRVGTRSSRFRGVVRIDVLGRTTRLVTDIVITYRSRTEITLNAAGPASAVRPISAAEARLARVLVSRVRA
jgi:hypothetical protein